MARFNKNRNMRRRTRRNNNNVPRGQRANGQVAYIPRNPTLGRVIRKVCVTRDNISIVTGTASLVFKSNTLASRPIGPLIASSFDFLQLVNAYTICKIHSLRVSIARVVGEISFNASGLQMNPVYCSFYPSRVNSSGLAAIECENSLVVPGLTLDVFTKTFPMISTSSLVNSGGINFFVNPTDWIDVGIFSFIPGLLLIGWTNPTNATLTTDLYSIQVFADLSFASPI